MTLWAATQDLPSLGICRADWGYVGYNTYVDRHNLLCWHRVRPATGVGVLDERGTKLKTHTMNQAQAEPQVVAYSQASCNSPTAVSGQHHHSVTAAQQT
jgi:hypothetical protein